MHILPHTVLIIYPLIIQSAFRNPSVYLSLTDCKWQAYCYFKNAGLILTLALNINLSFFSANVE